MITVYKYGLRRPTVNAALVDEQMKLANRYQNRLIEIERERRDAVREILGTRDLEIDDLIQAARAVDLELAAAVAELRATRASTRSRSDTADQRARVKVLRERKKAALVEVRIARSELKEDATITAGLRETSVRANEKVRAARAICGVPWGTYLQIEAAVDASAKMPLWKKDEKGALFGEPNNPRFRRWDGHGGLAVHIQGRTLPALDVLRCSDNWLQLQIEDPRGTSKNAQKRRFGVFRMRVGTEGKEPIWAEWPILMHRPLPEGATINWASVKRDMVADRDQWSLHLTLRVPDDAPLKKYCGDGTVAVDLGWRLKGDGSIRVAYLMNDEGLEREVVVAPEILSGLRKVEDLESIRAQSKNVVAARLGKWLKASNPPAWMVEETEYLSRWKAPRRFVSLLRKWEAARWEGDEEGFDALKAWQADDLHLWRWQEHQRKKSLRRRKDQYRVLGSELAGKYRVLVLEDFDLRSMQRHKAPESEETEVEAARRQQKDVSCSELRNCLIQAFVSRGGRVVKVDPSMTTQTHFECGYSGRWNAAKQVDHLCEGCGRVFDQDANAAKNIMRLFRERPDGEEVEVTKRQAKWAQRGCHKDTARKDEHKDVELQSE